MMRSTPNEFILYGQGAWDYTTNADNIKAFWLAGAQRARNFESVYTVGMRGFGDCTLSVGLCIVQRSNVESQQCLYLRTQIFNYWRKSLQTRRPSSRVSMVTMCKMSRRFGLSVCFLPIGLRSERLILLVMQTKRLKVTMMLV